MEKERGFPNSFHEANISLIQKPDKDPSKKENCRPILLMSTNTKIPIQHPFMIKTVNIAGREGTYLNIIKAIYKPKHTASIILSGEKLSLFLYGQEQDKDIPPATFIQLSTRSSNQSN